MDKNKNLRDFFAAPANQTTRERIFFNRLSFDLKISAARSGYHLHLYEPDVDRDGFDIVVEDGEATLWFQTKAVLASAGTSTWEILNGLIRPNLVSAEHYGYDPVDAGRGGGVILIEIDDTSTSDQVVYSYTDYDIIAAIAEGYLLEFPKPKGRGKPAEPARDAAKALVEKVRQLKRGDKIPVPKKLFIRLKSAEALLGMMGLHTKDGYGVFALRNAYGLVRIDEVGKSALDAPMNMISALHHNIGLLLAAQASASQATNRFGSFTWIKPPTP